jgi:nicotinamide phosphoribosyltransferase
MKKENLLLDVDSYKMSHFLQYPPAADGLYCYLESRGGRYTSTLFFGLQYILEKLAQGITHADIDEARELMTAHGLPMPVQGLRRIVAERDGAIPVRIRAVPEGSVVPTNNVLMTVESTDPQAFWMASLIETQLMRVWYPTTVATQSWHIRRLISSYLDRTADDPAAEIAFKLHDFGARGVSSRESAALGGCAHLVSFKGTDTVASLVLARDTYNERMAGFSIPAAEHSTITAWGRDSESAAYANMLQQFAKPGSLVAVVSDSYDLWNAVDRIWGSELRDHVVSSGATIVIRPDSGSPPEVVLKTLRLLEARFGVSYNTKAFKVLNNVRVIQGDGINEDTIRAILDVATNEGFSATNIAFGMGGALLQQVNRDTQRFAYKASEVSIAGQRRAICKDPVTDPGKASKPGRLSLIRRDGKLQTVSGDVPGSELVTVFEDGKLLHRMSLAEIRRRALDA